MGKFDDGQLRGAYSAGYEAGVRAGAERMRSEGWRRWMDGDPAPREGQLVKALVPTIGGWIGIGKVLYSDRTGVTVLKMDKVTGDRDDDRLNTASLCLHEIAVRFAEDY